MKKTRLAMVFLLVLLAAGVLGGATVAAPQANTRPLVRSSDLSKCGTVYVTAAEGPCAPRSGPGELAGWTEGYSTCMVVVSPANKEKAGLVGSTSFRYASSVEARHALEKVQNPDIAYGVATFGDGKAAIDANVLKLLEGQTGLWRAWYGTDHDGMPGYLLRFQKGNNVAEVQVFALPGQEAFGRRLLNDAARALLRPSLEEPLSASISNVATPKIGSQWYGRANAYKVDFYTFGELAAFWQYNDAHDAHYHGPGGDAVTCNSDHGCISNWYWRSRSLTYPDAQLEVPKFWAATYANDSLYWYNYDAECWFN